VAHPKVVVLILTYNGRYLLDEAVFSYLENDYPNFKVAVIDNGSHDGTCAYVEKRFPGVKTIRLDRNYGYSRGFNVGLEYAFESEHARYALISNNDVKVDKNVISELIKVAETNGKIGFVSGKVYYYDHADTFQTVGKKEDPVRWNGEHIGNREKDQGQYEEISERVFMDDIFTLVNKNVYDAVGGYDPVFHLQSEEFDWQARAKKAGFRIMYAPRAKLWHKDSMTIGRDSSRKAFYDARNPTLVILLHRSRTFFRRYFWHHFIQGILKSSLIALKKGKISIILAKWQGFFSSIAWGSKNRKLSFGHFV